VFISLLLSTGLQGIQIDIFMVIYETGKQCKNSNSFYIKIFRIQAYMRNNTKYQIKTRSKISFVIN
jgi:hypothetical protein